QEERELELTVAGTKEGINMDEAGAEAVTEEIILDAIMFGHEEIVRLVEFQEEIVNALNVEKFVPEVFVLDEDIEKEVESKATNRKSTRLNSSHVSISYAVFCLKKKKSTLR